MSDQNTAQLIGRTLAHKYTIESIVGTGAMGTIYRARQIALDKTVAVKVLHQPLAEDPSFVERFKLEAFSASRLEHPNSLRVLDFGKDEDLLYLVMEYVEAENLLSVMEAEWPFDDRRIVQITAQILAALAKAHEVGIVHRDLKPENVLVLRGTDDEGNPTDLVKVCDFGIAKIALADSHPFAPHLTSEGIIVGTPDYMSPEQARGDDVDARSDLYAMGVVLYHLLTGKTPFIADTPLGIAVLHVTQAPVPPSAHRVVNPALEAVCLQAMSKRPEERYQSAREMRRAVQATVGEASMPPLPHGSPTPTEGLPTVQARPRYASSTPPSEISLGDADDLTNPFASAATRRRRVAIAAFGIVGVAAAASAIGGRASFWQRDEVRSTTVALASGPQVTASAAETESPPLTGPSLGISPSDLPRAAGARTAEQRARRPTTQVQASGSRRLPEPAPATSPVSGQAGEPAAPPPDLSAPLPALVETMPAAPSAPAARAQAPVPEPVPALPLPPADPSRASVAIANVNASSGISGAKVKLALSHLPLANCYRQALVRRGAAVAVQSVLKIDIDLTGRVIGASLSEDGNLPGLRSCVESTLRGAQIRDVDTGDGFATVNLTFTPQ